MLLRLTPYAILLMLFFAAWLGSEDKKPAASFDLVALPKHAQEDEARRCSDIALGRLSINSQEDGQAIAKKAFDECKSKWNLAADAVGEHIGGISKPGNLNVCKATKLNPVDRSKIFASFRNVYVKSLVPAIQGLKSFSKTTRFSKP